MDVLPILIFAFGVVLLAGAGRLYPQASTPAGTRIVESLKAQRGAAVSSLVPLIMQVVVTLALLAAGLFIVLSSSYTPQAQHWGYGTLGSILGFWLKR